MLEKILESPLDCKEIQPVHPKGSQPWIFIARIDAEAEAPILWPPDAKSKLTVKDRDAEKDWGQEEKGMMVGWHGHEFQQTPRDSEGQGSWHAAGHNCVAEQKIDLPFCSESHVAIQSLLHTT